MEFYFSDANLRQSKFLLPLYQNDPWITISTFLTFNRVASMLVEILGENVEQDIRVAELVKAISVVDSTTIVLSDCKTKVGRQAPFVPALPTQVDSATIYVENLPAEVDHEHLRTTFSAYGDVLYVSLPKYKSGRSKGFAFIEFSTFEVVDKVLAEFTSVDIANPGELASVRTFNEEKEGDKENRDNKRKGINADKEASKAKKVKTSETPSIDSDQCVDNFDLAEIGGEVLEKQVSDIRVLSKMQWKKLRNKYLDEQRKNFAAVKNSLRKTKTPHPREKVEVKGEGEKFKDTKDVKKVDVDPKDIVKTGVIVKLTVPGGVDNIQKLKQGVREGLDGEAVAYVDSKVGVELVFVRCVDRGQAIKLVGVELREGWKGEVLTGKEEQSYHEKIERDKEEKRNGKVVVKKPKNKTRIIQKAESIKSAHVYFD